MASEEVAGLAAGTLTAAERAFRLAAHYGWDDLIFTHMTVRVPGEAHHFLINP